MSRALLLWAFDNDEDSVSFRGKRILDDGLFYWCKIVFDDLMIRNNIKFMYNFYLMTVTPS